MFTRQDAETLDQTDPLRDYRQRFRLPEGMIYLDGNSLGPAPKSVFEELASAAGTEWADDLITSWNKAGWFKLTDTLGDRVGQLVGAAPGQCVVCDTTSINIYKALHAALSLRPDRTVIVSEGGSFPTDLYMIDGVIQTRPDLTVRLEGRDAVTLEELIDETVAVVLVNQVDYRSGRIRDMAKVTEQAHKAGAIVVWDLCHSAGNMPVDLDGCDADFAVGCSYKYLNGGPGAPAFIYAARRHHGQFRQPLSGWWGHQAPFEFNQNYQADPGIRAMLCGTQPILSLRAMKAGLDAVADVDLQLIRQKSMAMTDLFIRLVEERCEGYGLSLFSPREARMRGSQVSFRHENGFAIVQALIDRKVIGDFRKPDIMRFGFAPLYLRFADVWDAADHLEQVLRTEEWRQDRFQVKGEVT
ncbi:kynureninase [Coralliovum pocilloporae]|uniref:kynureninase n=1 Tax=Coralliovum pocilloporae TaxID=3066369 RepID=UPI00330734B2